MNGSIMGPTILIKCMKMENVGIVFKKWGMEMEKVDLENCESRGTTEHLNIMRAHLGYVSVGPRLTDV